MRAEMKKKLRNILLCSMPFELSVGIDRFRASLYNTGKKTVLEGAIDLKKNRECTKQNEGVLSLSVDEPLKAAASYSRDVEIKLASVIENENVPQDVKMAVLDTIDKRNRNLTAIYITGISLTALTVLGCYGIRCRFYSK